ncbi:MAG: hypothetical protein CL670_13200 [Balneola sp.]|jgi:hypothetical protein|nr:hypothetical protein [Balneola sp.]MBE80106.1 hypothetical protein [Balneola sp.]|tara:strand:+ start:337 stop:1443 length:1107 start_codon:yes stop_codon:yes gene_type:complete
MHKITLFPLGNADTSLIELENGKRILIDYADMKDSTDDDDKRIDLPNELKVLLGDEDSIDVVVFTHIDTDHIKGSPDFFNLLHADKYQSEDKIDINEMWVPAAAIVEEGVEADSRIIRQEARYRFKNGEGIKVFSTPGQLRDWADNQGIDLDSRSHLIVNAGETIEEFDLFSDGLEIFVHSPFAYRTKDGTLIDRNKDAIALNCKFHIDGTEVLFNTFSDLGSEEIKDIINISESYSNSDRLYWDIFKIPHHCSHKSLANVTAEEFSEPDETVSRLFEGYSNDVPLIISSSRVISDGDYDPPNKKASDYYKKVVSDKDGEFKVTMDHPTVSSPKPLVIKITGGGYEIEKKPLTGVGPIITERSERAGV